MTKLLASLLVTILALLLGPVATAHAGDPGCDDQADECSIVVVDPGSSSHKPSNPPDPSPRRQTTPDCADLGLFTVEGVAVA